jgi:hypothetical protein
MLAPPFYSTRAKQAALSSYSSQKPKRTTRVMEIEDDAIRVFFQLLLSSALGKCCIDGQALLKTVRAQEGEMLR